MPSTRVHSDLFMTTACLQGFYSVYARVFQKVAEQESAAAEAASSKDQRTDAPSFGKGLETSRPSCFQSKAPCVSLNRLQRFFSAWTRIVSSSSE